MSDYKEYKLRDLVTFSQGIQIPVEEQSNTRHSNMERFVRIVDFTNPNEEPRFIKIKDSKYWVNKKDVVMIRYGSATAGKVVRGLEGYIANNMFKVIPNKSILNEEFLYYFLSQSSIYSYLMNSQSSSTMPAIKFSDFDNIKIKLPSLDIQKHIVLKLNRLNDKIELNTQINQTLEQIAQALFKSWFVDFDPVRAKVQALSDGLSLEQAELAAIQAISGKTPEELTALSQTQPDRYAELAKTAKAFPCEMVEVDGVEVPKGWKIQYLKDICNIVYGKNLPTTKLIKEGYPVFGGNGVIGYYDKFLYETPQTLVSCRGAASGKVLYSLPYSFVTNNSLVIEHEKSGLSYFYIYETLKLQNLTELTSGSAQPQMTIANMASIQILIPSEKINEVYKKYVGTLYDKKYHNNIENETLAQTRDLLLPRLLSGDFNG